MPQVAKGNKNIWATNSLLPLAVYFEPNKR